MPKRPVCQQAAPSGASSPAPATSKLYYSISEVAELTGVKPHVLRYWEEQFSTLRPRKGRSGNRTYRSRDIEEVLAIKKLLYQDGFRIEGAVRLRREARLGRQELPQDPPPQLAIPFHELSAAQQAAHLKTELGAVRDLLQRLHGEIALCRDLLAGKRSGPAAGDQRAGGPAPPRARAEKA